MHLVTKPSAVNAVIVRKSVAAPSQVAIKDVSARIERRLGEYLRSWGLNDDEIIAAHARRWTRHVLHEAAGGAGPSRIAYLELEQRALARAMSAVYLWIARVTRLLERDGEEVSKGLPTMRIRRLLATEPHAFLRIKELPPTPCSPVMVPPRAMAAARLGLWCLMPRCARCRSSRWASSFHCSRRRRTGRWSGTLPPGVSAAVETLGGRILDASL